MLRMKCFQISIMCLIKSVDTNVYSWNMCVQHSLQSEAFCRTFHVQFPHDYHVLPGMSRPTAFQTTLRRVTISRKVPEQFSVFFGGIWRELNIWRTFLLVYRQQYCPNVTYIYVLPDRIVKTLSICIKRMRKVQSRTWNEVKNLCKSVLQEIRSQQYIYIIHRQKFQLGNLYKHFSELIRTLIDCQPSLSRYTRNLTVQSAPHSSFPVRQPTAIAKPLHIFKNMVTAYYIRPLSPT